MIKFKAGLLPPVTDDAGKARIAAASDLVKRTLAQHGLASPLGAEQSGFVQSGLPAMASKLAGVNALFANDSTHGVLIPDGAEYRQNQFKCTAGTREYRTYIPSTASDSVTGIVVMLHGCTQNADDFAIGTGMNALAEKHRFIVAYPQQSRGDNAQSCWNWFNRSDQHRDRGEPVILAGMTRQLMEEFDVPNGQTFVAGLSAGAAMAVILGETYPDVFSAVGAHSGLPFGSAQDVPSAYAAMAGSVPETAYSVVTDAPAVRTIVFHGTADATVHPSNSDRIARQVMNRGARQAIETDKQGSACGRSFNRKVSATANGATELEHWLVEGLGHAWSGGQPGGSYIDTKGPDASAEMIRFFFENNAKETLTL